MVPLEEIYCLMDDFCKIFEEGQKSWCLPRPNHKRKRACALSLSEIMTILVLFHLSHYRTFKDFYLHCLLKTMRKDFPRAVSYTRFVELIPHALMPLIALIQGFSGKQTGTYYVDSTQLSVCHNLRIARHKVFKHLAKRGKTSTGWFFGFKLHLVINHHGEIMKVVLTPGNVDDRKMLDKLTANLTGWLFGDKGYLGKNIKDSLLKRGLDLITRAKKNMKKIPLSAVQKFYLSKRGIIETVIGQLKAICHIQHTRHRSPTNWITNIMAGLLAYILKPLKPSVRFHQLNHLSTNLTCLTSN